VDKQVTDNVLVVAQGNEHPALFKTQLSAADVIWVSGEPPALPLNCHAKIRYRQTDQPCVVSASGARLEVTFATPQRAVTPGQSVVFYEQDICLGGGIIEGAQ
jgi:tRNA-specific 2-thiouridylase